MRLLLDTQIFLWLESAPRRLASLLPVLSDTDNELLLSAASSWEIAIKAGLGKLSLPAAPSAYVLSRMQRSGIAGLPVEHRHALAVADLVDHHRDPFDRLLIAQTTVEKLTLVTADPVFDLYGLETLRP